MLAIPSIERRQARRESHIHVVHVSPISPRVSSPMERLEETKCSNRRLTGRGLVS